MSGCRKSRQDAKIHPIYRSVRREKDPSDEDPLESIEDSGVLEGVMSGMWMRSAKRF